MTIAKTFNGHAPAILAETLQTLHRRFGSAGKIIPANELPPVVSVIPTGFPTLDTASGVGGLPRGRIVDIFGPEGSGKTTICLRTIAETQRQGGQALFIDTENGFDLKYALQCGIDPDRLFIAQPGCAEEALEITLALVKAGIELVIIDSVAGLVPRAEVETDIGDNHTGLMAGLMSQALRKLAGPLQKNNTLLIVTNQLRHRVGVLFGASQTSTGGMALRHYASVRLDVRPTQAIKRH